MSRQSFPRFILQQQCSWHGLSLENGYHAGKDWHSAGADGYTVDFIIINTPLFV
jgi:hypothetical protein